MPTIRAIVFDWYGVIWTFPGKFNSIVAAFLGVSLDEFECVYYRHNHLWNKGLVRDKRLAWRLVLDELGKSGKLDALMVFLETQSLGKVDERVVQFIGFLKTQGYKIGLLSNASFKNSAVMRRPEFMTLFDASVLSYEVGYQKPEPQIFLAMAQRLGIDTSEFIFIDDSPKSLSTAKEVGYVPVLYQDLDGLTEQLVERGLLKEHPLHPV